MKKIILLIMSFFIVVPIVYADETIIISDVQSALDAIEKIYSDDKEIGDYFLEAKDETVDMLNIYNVIVDKYRSPFDKNIYKYDEYGIVHFDKFYADLSDNRIHVNNYNKLITEKEKNKAVKVADKIIMKFKDYDYYNKVYAIYSYISNTVKYPTKYNSNLLLDSYLSIYDTLVTKTGDCTGKAILFQYLAEQLGIESYIVDRVTSANFENGEYSTNHTYNIVKLDDVWYIVDIFDDGNMNGLLIGKNNNYQNDTYNNIEVSSENYTRPVNHVDVDFDIKDDFNNNWPLLISILLIILFAILFFTKR